MGEIFEMPQRLREKIAAGEVITSPYSVVKELIENSMDAGADEIKVYIEKGGKRLIRVVDNGKGMDKDDLLICSKRFTTSKIHSDDDLQRIETLGFRGEALASIAAVSELQIQSIKNGASKGYAVEYGDDGTPLLIKESPIVKGTIVEVRNLFSRFPVRLKFLKSDDVEASKIVSLVTKYSLANPNISFHLYKEGIEIFNSPKCDELGKIFYAFGQEIADNVVRIEHLTEGIAIRGYISKIGYSRKTRDYQAIFVNNRLIKNTTITNAIEKGYTDKLFLGRYPVAILHIEMDAGMIDVNIHPSKEEIKFKNEQLIEDVVLNAVQRSILGSSNAIISNMEGKMLKPQHTYTVEKGIQTVLSDVSVQTTIKTDSRKIIAKPNEEFLDITVLGQLNKTYIVGFDTSGLVLIDQHAAQERVFYEKFTTQLKENAVAVNKLLKPFIFSVSYNEEKLIEENKSILERYGFSVEMVGKNEYALTSVPALFGKTFDANVIKDVLDELKENGHSLITIDDELDLKIATRACRKAVKGGDDLTMQQMKSLITELSKCKNPYTCPHGRPTIIKISWGDIEKKFKRSD